MHAILRTLLAVTTCAGCLGACSTPGGAPVTVTGSYDGESGKLRQITLDSTGNGRIDTWSHMDGARVLRIDLDTNDDGAIDRWEYYGTDGRLEKIGYSRIGNGQPDAWAWSDPAGQLARLELADVATGAIIRTEFYEGGVIRRAIDDADGDGRPEKWEEYAGGRLIGLSLDLSGRGTPERRLHYGDDGSLERIEDLGDEHNPSDLPTQRARSDQR
jgi:hypothetical protein